MIKEVACAFGVAFMLLSIVESAPTPVILIPYGHFIPYWITTYRVPEVAVPAEVTPTTRLSAPSVPRPSSRGLLHYLYNALFGYQGGYGSYYNGNYGGSGSGPGVAPFDSAVASRPAIPTPFGGPPSNQPFGGPSNQPFGGPSNQPFSSSNAPFIPNNAPYDPNNAAYPATSLHFHFNTSNPLGNTNLNNYNGDPAALIASLFPPSQPSVSVLLY